ncbi:MAG: hypothetical protein K0B81_08465 [Candidatus Cloacimonetes bacterium]|nr:hypothetical protein [Candidatus Cloacimonadota bacterium]
MANDHWLNQEVLFLKGIELIEIPDDTLKNVDNLTIKKNTDLSLIPDGGGCYWIWTNEQIVHSFHKNPIPPRYNSGEFIYNGIAKDNIRVRIARHLFSQIDSTWSAISVDIYPGDTRSHRKKALSSNSKGKVPYIDEHRIRSIEELLSLPNLTQDEKDYVNSITTGDVYFRNGINVTESKHRKFTYKVYYIVKLRSIYMDYIEKKWREKYGVPKLCSYLSGR